MKFSLIFLLIANAFTINNFYIYDILYGHRYIIDPLKFPSNKIPIGTHYFRISVENATKKKATIKLTVKQNDIANFKINFYSFFDRPNDSEILNLTNNTDVEFKSQYFTNKYTNYAFKAPYLKKEQKTKYFLISIINYKALDYLSVYVYPEYSKDIPLEYTIYNINYMKEEILNKTALNQHKGGFIFILENEELKKNKLIRIKLKKEYSNSIRLEFAGYKERPIFEEELRNPVYKDHAHLESTTLGKDYNTYEYEYLLEDPTVIEQNYLVFDLFLEESVDFVSFYVGPES